MFLASEWSLRRMQSSASSTLVLWLTVPSAASRLVLRIHLAKSPEARKIAVVKACGMSMPTPDLVPVAAVHTNRLACMRFGSWKMMSALLIKPSANKGSPTSTGTSPASKAAARESISGYDIFCRRKQSPFGRVARYKVER